MNWGILRRIFPVNVRLFLRKWPVLFLSCALLTIGMIEVIFVIAISSEIRTQLAAGELGDYQIVTRAGMSDELASVLSNEEIEDIRAIAANTGATVIPQSLRQAPLQEEADNPFGPRAIVRGVDDLRVLESMMGISLASGRWPKPGEDELIAGTGFTTPNDQEPLGRAIKLDGRTFRIVGTFDSGEQPFGNELLGETSQTRTETANWSSVWIKVPEADHSRLTTLLETQLKGSVEMRDAQSYFEEKYSDSRGITSAFSLALIIVVTFATIAAFASTMEILISIFRREFDIMYLIGIDRRELVASLIFVGMLQGLLTGLAALSFVVVFFGQRAFEIPIGNQNFLIAPAIDFVSVGVGLAVASTTGVLGMLIAGRKIGRLSSGA